MIRTIVTLGCLILLLTACTGTTKQQFEVIYSLGTQEDAVTLSSHSQTEEKNESDNQIIALVSSSNHSYFTYAMEGAQEAGRELGIQVIFEMPLFPTVDQQIMIVKELMKRGVDVIAIAAVDAEQLLPVLAEARNQGIKVITWDSDTMLTGREFFISGVEMEQLGRQLMDNMAQAMGKKGDFSIISHSSGLEYTEVLIKWINIQLNEYYPQMKLASVITEEFNLTEWLTEQANEKGILDLSFIDPNNIVEAIKEAGLDGQVHVTGLYLPGRINQYLKEGSLYMATLWSPKKLGYLTVILAGQLLENHYPMDGQNIETIGKIRMIGNTVIMGDPLNFTRENVDQYGF